MSIFPREGRMRPVNPVVQGVLGGIYQGRDKFIAPRVLPGKDTQGNRTGTIVRVGDSAFFGNLNQKIKRAPGSGFARSPGVELDDATTFRCENRALDGFIPLEHITDEDVAVDLYGLQMEAQVNDLLIEQELALATLLSSATWGTDTTLAGSNVWSDPDADPMKNVEDLIDDVSKFGPDVNTLIFTYDAGKEFRRHPAVADLMPTTGTRHRLSKPRLAELMKDEFGVPLERVFTLEAGYNSAAIGQTFAYARIASGWVWAGYIDIGEQAGNMVEGTMQVPIRPSAAARFVMSDPIEADPEGRRIPVGYEDFDDKDTNSRVVRTGHSYDMTQITAKLGGLLTV